MRLLHKNIYPVVIFLIIILAILLRLVYLDRFPTSVSGDELIYPFTAKAVSLIGTDITGTWNIFQSLIFKYPPNQMQAELPYFIHLPFMALFPFSLNIVRLPYALFSIGTVILLMLISNKIFNKKIALVVGIISAINPWNVVMGRTSYEVIPSTLFYLILCYLLITYKKQYIPIIIATMFLAFYSYIGTKIILFPLVLISLGYFIVKKKEKINFQHISLLFIPIFITIFFLISIRTHQSRITDLFFPNSPIISSEVDNLRKSTIASPLTSILINKFTVYFQVLTERFFRILSPDYLFINGDLFFPLQNYGFFYAIDFIFIFIGILSMYRHNKLELLTILLLLGLGTTPHIFFRLSGDFSPHLGLFYPWLILLTGFGIVNAISWVPKKSKKYAIFALFFLYGFFFLQFIQKNFYYQPWQNNGDFDSRILSHYLKIGDKKREYIIYSNSGKDIFAKYIFYTNSMDIHSIRDIQNSWNKSALRLYNISFENCPFEETEYKEDITYIVSNACYKTQHFKAKLTIPILKDGGEKYAIINDTICNKYSLKRYPAGLTINSFSIEKLHKQEFCESFITVL